MEVVWEKGGSGLVFYTDTNFWKEQDGGKLYSNVAHVRLRRCVAGIVCIQFVCPYMYLYTVYSV